METNKPSCIYNNCSNEARWIVGELSGTNLLYCDEHLYWGLLVIELFKTAQIKDKKQRGSRELDIVLSQKNIAIYKNKAKEMIKKDRGNIKNV